MALLQPIVWNKAPDNCVLQSAVRLGKLEA
jgi:hypothetical protein